MGWRERFKSGANGGKGNSRRRHKLQLKTRLQLPLERRDDLRSVQVRERSAGIPRMKFLCPWISLLRSSRFWVVGQFSVRGNDAGGSLFLPRVSEWRFYPDVLVIIRRHSTYASMH